MLELLHDFLTRAADESTSRPKDRRTTLLDPVYVAFVASESTLQHDEAVAVRLDELCTRRSWHFVCLHLDGACDRPGGAEEMLESLSATSAETAREHLRTRALREAAKERGCTVLFSGETSERLAIRTLRSIAEGQAWALGEMVGSIVEQSPGAASPAWRAHTADLHVVRPMGSIALADAQALCRLRGVEPSATPASTAPTVGSHVERFVLGLADSFVSTVPSVNRIAGKLKLRSDQADVARCPLCSLCAVLHISTDERRPSDPSASAWLADNATYALDEAALAKRELSTVERTLCYACLVLIRDRQAGAGDGALPAFVGHEADAEAARRAAMRRDQHGAIADCLLGEEDA